MSKVISRSNEYLMEPKRNAIGQLTDSISPKLKIYGKKCLCTLSHKIGANVGLIIHEVDNLFNINPSFYFFLKLHGLFLLLINQLKQKFKKL